MSGGTATDPRVKRSRRVVQEAALAEFARAGYGGFTIESVAARSGVARSTIYRHWPDKLSLLSDALDTLNQQPALPADTAGEDHRAAVTLLVSHLAAAWQDPGRSAVVPALIEAAEHDPGVRRFFHRYNAQRRRALTDAIRRGLDAGQIAEGIDPEAASVALAGAVLYRRVMTPRPVRSGEVEGLITDVLGPPPRRRPSRR